MRAPEHNLQSLLVQRCRLERQRYPELALLYAIPNGGQRNRVVAAKLKAEGVQAGVPDLCLPVARGPYHGLYLETKVRELVPHETKTKGITMRKRETKPSAAQEEWICALREQGYCAEVYWDLDEGWSILTEYLEADHA